MGTRCKLCGRRATDSSAVDACTCGWRLDANCYRNHREWCPATGPDRWIGAVEI
ncbi:MAG: hypothetical protein ABEJ31_03890 [Haloarculaceae archaeon]